MSRKKGCRVDRMERRRETTGGGYRYIKHTLLFILPWKRLRHMIVTNTFATEYYSYFILKVVNH